MSSLPAKSSGVASSPGVLSTSIGGALFGSVSSSASLISASLVIAPTKPASIWNVIGTAVLAPAAKTGINEFNVAEVPVIVQFASTSVSPAGM